MDLRELWVTPNATVALQDLANQQIALAPLVGKMDERAMRHQFAPAREARPNLESGQDRGALKAAPIWSLPQSSPELAKHPHFTHNPPCPSKCVNAWAIRASRKLLEFRSFYGLDT